MTFLAPAFMIAAGFIAAAVVALHFIVTREPRTVALPTARFAPVRPVRARSRRIRLQDLLLLLLRVLLILAVGAALAEPVLDPPQRDVARILLVDRSRAVADPAEVADSARALLGEGDAVVLFDTAAVVAREGAADSIAAIAVLGPSDARGRLSPAIIAALRTASEMRERADSFELAIVSPLVAEELDRATDSIRTLWPGSVRLVPVAARTDSATATPVVAVAGERDDPLRLALPATATGGDVDAAGAVRVVRGATSAADSAWAREGEGRALVHWPAVHAADATTGGAATLSGRWSARATPDTVGAVIADGVVLVAPFERFAAYDGAADSAAADGAARVVARWVDGTPAAVETPLGAGCARTVAVGVPSVGDLVLQPRFRRLAAALTGPCGGRATLDAPDSARVAAIAGAGPYALAAGSAIAPPEAVRSPLVPWLLGAALLFALAALLLQRRTSNAAVSVTGGASA